MGAKNQEQCQRHAVLVSHILCGYSETAWFQIPHLPSGANCINMLYYGVFRRLDNELQTKDFMKKAILALATLLSVCAFGETINGYTYDITAIYSGGLLDGVKLWPSRGHAVEPKPSGDFVIPSHFQWVTDYGSKTNLLPLVAITDYTNGSTHFDYTLSSTYLTSVVIPDTVRTIGYTVFAGCDNLKSVSLPSQLEILGGAAFLGCVSLEDIKLPSGVVSLGESVFAGCCSLTNISINAGLLQIGASAFSSGYVNSIAYPACTNLTEIAIPSSVTNIGMSAFMDCTGLRKVDVGGGRIGDYAFIRCTELRELTLGDNVTGIGMSAFEGCTSLTNVHIGSGVNRIGTSAFKNCTNLTSVVIPDSVEYIDASAFEGCTSLTNVHIGSGVNRIGTSAFKGCSALGEIVIPDEVASVGNNAFSGCMSIANAVIGTGLNTLGDSAFNNCTSLESVTIKNGEIGNWAFVGCMALKEARLLDGVTKVGWQAFQGLTNLVTVTFGDTIADFGENSFYNTAITNIHLSSCVTNIGSMAFYGTKITELEIPGTHDCLRNSYRQFESCHQLTNVIVHSGITSLYQSFQGCSSLVSITLPDGLKNISAAFWGCRSLEHLDIPASVRYISGAFQECSKLGDVNLPEGITETGTWTFYNCTSMKNIVLPNSVTNIGQYAFGGGSFSDTTVTFGTNLQSVAYMSFGYMPKVIALCALPSGDSYLPNCDKCLIVKEHLNTWLPWIKSKRPSASYAIYDEVSGKEIAVNFGEDGVRLVQWSAAMGIDPAISTDLEGNQTATYKKPALELDSFDSQAGVVRLHVDVPEGCSIGSGLATECVVVEGSDDMTTWTPVTTLAVDASSYLQEGSVGHFSCAFDPSEYSFYQVEVNGK